MILDLSSSSEYWEATIDMPETAIHAEAIPWMLRAKNSISYVCPKANTSDNNERVYKSAFVYSKSLILSAKLTDGNFVKVKFNKII